MAATEYDFILTRNELIAQAYEKIGAVGPGQNISSNMLATANKKLNLILKSWSGDGIHLWTNITETITTVDGTVSYSLPTTNGAMYVDRALILESDNRLELSRMSHHDYVTYVNLENEGKPCSFHHNISENKIYLLPVPNAAWSIDLLCIKKLKDWESESSTGEFPSVWQVAIKYALAVELGEDFSIPLKELAYLRSVAESEKNRARSKENDHSAYSPCVAGAY